MKKNYKYPRAKELKLLEKVDMYGTVNKQKKLIYCPDVLTMTEYGYLKSRDWEIHLYDSFLTKPIGDKDSAYYEEEDDIFNAI